MFVKFKWTVKQAIWRILRWADNPILVDFQDKNLYNQVRERIQAYKEEFWNDVKIERAPVHECILEMISADRDHICWKIYQAVQNIYQFKKTKQYEDIF